MRSRTTIALLATASLLGGCGDAEGPQPTAVSAPTDHSTPASATAAHFPPAPAIDGPRLRVLGIAQDGGMPHPACSGPNCTRGRRDPARARRVSCLGLYLPGAGQTYLFDATPDLESQLAELMRYRRPGAVVGRVDRAPLDGVFLTHAHIGHYLGLAFFGFETVSTEGLAVWATPRMAAFLRANGPWGLMVDKGNIAIRELEPRGPAVELADGVEVTAIPAPHRDEYSDTVAYRIAGPRKTALFVPDTDQWSTWDPPLLEVIEGVDVALVDATFFSLDELPGRDISEVPHPLMRQTMDLLGDRVKAGSLRVIFIHLNHSNPAYAEDGPERAEIRRRGFEVAREGMEIEL